MAGKVAQLLQLVSENKCAQNTGLGGDAVECVVGQAASTSRYTFIIKQIAFIVLLCVRPLLLILSLIRPFRQSGELFCVLLYA